MIKITASLIEEVVSEVAGKDTIPLVNLLKGQKEKISEFKIADDLDLDIKEVRNMLYRLYKHNLVSFNRKKDKQKGWYIYYWDFNKPLIEHLYFIIKKDKLEKLKERLVREQTHKFYLCPRGCVRADFDQATEWFYKCPECDSIMQEQDNERTIDHLTKLIAELENDLKKERQSSILKNARKKTATKKVVAPKKTSKKKTVLKKKTTTSKKKITTKKKR
ncbi:hypothetical protein GOV04_01615 [Candidatus Woesearchaeota archaeon]|nr:hypothetical protein [Candidatus Woesearchaeota archaeon]